MLLVVGRDDVTVEVGLRGVTSHWPSPNGVACTPRSAKPFHCRRPHRDRDQEGPRNRVDYRFSLTPVWRDVLSRNGLAVRVGWPA
jgi:hypothetical protein